MTDIDQWNRIELTNIPIHTRSVAFWSTNGVKTAGYIHLDIGWYGGEMNPRPPDVFLIKCIKHYLKWLIYLNIKVKTIKALEENRTNSYQLWDRQVFLRTQKTISCKRKYIDKLDFMKIKAICSYEETVKKLKQQAIDWEKIFTIQKTCWVIT